MKYFMWRFLNNALATTENLHARKCSPSCPICCSEIESIEHIILRCDWASKVWISASLSMCIQEDSTAAKRRFTWVLKLSLVSSPFQGHPWSMCLCVLVYLDQLKHFSLQWRQPRSELSCWISFDGFWRDCDSFERRCRGLCKSQIIILARQFGPRLFWDSKSLIETQRLKVQLRLSAVYLEMIMVR